MFRLRRYRIFLLVAILTTLTLYHLTNVRNWETTTTTTNVGADIHKSPGSGQSPVGASKDKNPDKSTDKSTKPGAQDAISSPAALDPASMIKATSTAKSSTSSTLLDVVQPTPTKSTSSKKPEQTNLEELDTEPAIPASEIKDQIQQNGQGRLEVDPLDPEAPHPRWKKPIEKFPVASLIPLPTGKSKPIPPVQAKFKEETAAEKTERERKQAAVKEAFVHAWTGYREHALPHDELTPVSGESRNPFNGWGATLVDTLDTLWIMGLTEEFEFAVKAVEKIDFHTTARKDIPLFETVIRYLGGLLAAYDICDMKYPSLLTKAEELAEVLMGAFDTPNRMPITYYNWAPSYSSQPHRASTRVVLAELGSLSMEFTRLAQLTKEDKYYDAIARITDALDLAQNTTRLPGLWPVHVDASGCAKPSGNQGLSDSTGGPSNPPASQGMKPAGSSSKATTESSSAGNAEAASSKEKIEKPAVESSSKDTSGTSSTGATADKEKTVKKRQLNDPSLDVKPAVPKVAAMGAPPAAAPKTTFQNKAHNSISSQTVLEEVDCEPQGLASPPYRKTDKFSLGAMTDSTFEYLPKEYLLLGGQVDQYRKMYEYAMDAARENLLFRPMTKDRDILFAGKLETPGPPKKKELDSELIIQEDDFEPSFDYEVAHLTCFTGGMFALGAKIFDIPGDMEIARKLTDGCVWAYEITPTGIMPEAALVVPCETTKSCAWNETKWWDAVDPFAEQRMQRTRDWNEEQRKLAEQLAAAEAKQKELPLNSGMATEVDGASTHTSDLLDFAEPIKSDNTKNSQSDSTTDTKTDTTTSKNETPAGEKASKPIGKRDASAAAADVKPVAAVKDNEAVAPKETPTKTVETKEISKEDDPTKVSPPGSHVTDVMKSLFTPIPVTSHEEYAKLRIEDQRLPEGFTDLIAKKYILRPEAIESVFIMYRITGDKYWQESGWNMFTSIQKATRTEFGNSAIRDVTSSVPVHDDTMESFWLAETLKYFYLLYSEPNVVSLDDWVFNTEAHPFRRPK